MMNSSLNHFTYRGKYVSGISLLVNCVSHSFSSQFNLIFFIFVHFIESKSVVFWVDMILESCAYRRSVSMNKYTSYIFNVSNKKQTEKLFFSFRVSKQMREEVAIHLHYRIEKFNIRLIFIYLTGQIFICLVLPLELNNKKK